MVFQHQNYLILKSVIKQPNQPKNPDNKKEGTWVLTPAYGHIALPFDDTIKRDEKLKKTLTNHFFPSEIWRNAGAKSEIDIQMISCNWKGYVWNTIRSGVIPPAAGWLSHAVAEMLHLPIVSVNAIGLMFISDWQMPFRTLFSLALTLFWKNHFKIKMEQEAEFSLKKRWPRILLKRWHLR